MLYVQDVVASQETVSQCRLTDKSLEDLIQHLMALTDPLRSTILVRVCLSRGLDLKLLLRKEQEMVKNNVIHTLKFKYNPKYEPDKVYESFFHGKVYVVSRYENPCSIPKNIYKFTNFEQFSNCVMEMKDDDYLEDPEWCDDEFLSRTYKLSQLIGLYNSLQSKGIEIDADKLTIFTNPEMMSMLYDLNRSETHHDNLVLASMLNAEYNNLFKT